MATNFPTSLDSFTNPTAANYLNSPSHAGQHANANDSIAALEAKLGINSSAVTTSVDYFIKHPASQTDVNTQTDNVKFVTALGLSQSILFHGVEGALINGKIVPSVASNNLTVAIKTMAGADPSAAEPVMVRLNGVIYSITAALSVTKNAATNWCNAGSAELATKEIDYFVYLGYNATDGVTIGFSRIPYAAQYSDFSVTTTNEKYCAISTITNAAATDYYNVIGRFAATLSAGAGYTWSVPTFTAINLIQRPIWETRWLLYTPILTSSGGTAPTYVTNFVNRYRIVNLDVETENIWNNGTGGVAGSGGNGLNITIPFSISSALNIANRAIIGFGSCYESGGTIAICLVQYVSATLISLYQSTSGAIISANDQSSDLRYINFRNKYEI